MRTLAHIAAAYAVTLLFGALWRVAPFEVVAPSAPVVFAAYLGITARDRLPRATLGAVVIGYLADLLSGAPIGLHALVCGVVCVGSRLASLRLLVRGRVFVATFVLAGALVAEILVTAIRLASGGGVGSPLGRLVAGGGSALATAIIAPFLFRMCRRIDVAFARTEREREAVREGYLG